MRRKRFAYVRRLLDSIPRPYRILDVGGTPDFWMQMGFHDQPGVSVVILNIDIVQLAPAQFSGATEFISMVGDGRDLHQFQDAEFDVVFSNSVIEHVGTKDDQRSMMREVERVGKRYWVQTPNYWFPIEPHFHLPGFQFLPANLRAWLLTKADLGWVRRQDCFESALKTVHGTRLLTKDEMKQLAPGASFYDEWFMGLLKSFSAFKGWGQPGALA
ncbi:MAG: class I SAM-dependent methyltransferase [Proteobacteria bacterium]|nr:class I SAM-dependent methyltransferase [Pseudomonadota bacterium]